MKTSLAHQSAEGNPGTRARLPERSIVERLLLGLPAHRLLTQAEIAQRSGLDPHRVECVIQRMQATNDLTTQRYHTGRLSGYQLTDFRRARLARTDNLPMAAARPSDKNLATRLARSAGRPGTVTPNDAQRRWSSGRVFDPSTTTLRVQDDGTAGARTYTTASQTSRTPYLGTELQTNPGITPDRMEAFSLPSIMGPWRVWPDGRRERIDGQPVEALA